ncbi:GPP34 family phosphoprotein [Streptomyces sp. NPDC127108]|uniref:GPP34 family phosphoprotein n=1 Tax=Streptomyces sp. NPDC127108 TaxID=3345361 RepID=UPI00363A4020
MNTARDLANIALSRPDRSVGQGDLSLALAGAELLDLIAAQALRVEEDRIVPGERTATGDRLWDEASAQLVRQEPYESVEDWLWRRGRGLFAAYTDDLERTGQVTRTGGQQPASGDPVLAALVTVAGMQDGPDSALEDLADDATAAVLAAVGNAVTELEAVRQQRSIENAAFDNIWRAP